MKKKKRMKWTKERIVKEIKELNVPHKNIERDNKALCRAANRYFGSWENAIKASNLDYDKITTRKKWTKEKIINEIKLLDDKTCSNVKKNYNALYGAGYRHFGSWEKRQYNP